MPKKKKSACGYCGKYHPVWWNKAKYRDGWYLTVPDRDKANGQKQICLGRGWESHDDAIRAWHVMEAAIEVPALDTIQSPRGEEMRVGELVNLLLENLELTLSAGRYKDTKSYLNDFSSYFGNDTVAQMRVGGIARIEKWIAKHPGWQSASTLRSVISRVKQVFNNAVDQGYIATSPIKVFKRPKDVVRVSTFTNEQVEAILAEADKHFADFFRFLLLTGCRPGEGCLATVDSLRRDGGARDLHLLVNHKNKRHTGEDRRIYLLFSDVKMMILDSAKKYGSGPLFRTKTGKSWTNATLNNRFRKIAESKECVKLGLDRHSLEKNSDGTEVRRYEFVPYTCRHTFAFRLLTGFYKDRSGIPIKKNYGEVAIYMGNSAQMVERVYGKLAKATEMLGEEIA